MNSETQLVDCIKDFIRSRCLEAMIIELRLWLSTSLEIGSVLVLTNELHWKHGRISVDIERWKALAR